jgi:hypothetical protein
MLTLLMPLAPFPPSKPTRREILASGLVVENSVARQPIINAGVLRLRAIQPLFTIDLRCASLRMTGLFITWKPRKARPKPCLHRPEMWVRGGAGGGRASGLGRKRERRRPIWWPTRSEAYMRSPAVRPGSTRWCPTAARAIEATQPHWVQSGVPPNWQGPILVSRSADKDVVVLAKMHSSGDCGGWRSSSIICRFIWNLG